MKELTPDEIKASRKAIEKYLKFLNKISKQKCWEESQSISGFFMWLSKQEDK